MLGVGPNRAIILPRPSWRGFFCTGALTQLAALLAGTCIGGHRRGDSHPTAPRYGVRSATTIPCYDSACVQGGFPLCTARSWGLLRFGVDSHRPLHFSVSGSCETAFSADFSPLQGTPTNRSPCEQYFQHRSRPDDACVVRKGVLSPCGHAGKAEGDWAAAVTSDPTPSPIHPAP